MFEPSLAGLWGRAKSRPRVWLILVALSLWAGPAGAEPLVIETRPVALDAADPERRRLGDLVYLGGLELSSADGRFGGLSGLSIAADGGYMLAVSDRGQWVGARLIHDGAGVLIGIGEAEIMPLGDRDGNPLRGLLGDAEDIVALAGGGYAVSFERRHRILIYPSYPFAPGNNRGKPLSTPQTLATAPGNKGIEALAEIEPGRLLALTEGMFSGPDRLQGWIISTREAPAESLIYAIEGGFRPTALAKLPGGDMLALERAFSLAGGFRVRLMRIERAAIAPGATLRGREIARFGGALTVDNFEGLAVRRDARGRLLVYLISDDNFNGFQRTLLMQFEMVY